MSDKIYYTKTDEAPALASHSLLPIIEAFTAPAKIEVVIKDISLAGRILALFPDYLDQSQRCDDALASLGLLTDQPDTNIIKLPNISASLSQLQHAIQELQAKGFTIPNYPQEPDNDKEKAIKQRYSQVLGSAVNPILRQGNSDRRAPRAVKEFAQNNPQTMGIWEKDSKTAVASMESDDFYGTEQSLTLEKEGEYQIEFISDAGEIEILKSPSPLTIGEIVDSSVMRIASLRQYIRRNMARAKRENLLLSAHLKATMMKVSDPIIFGAMVHTYFSAVFTQFNTEFQALGVQPNQGLADLYQKIKNDLKCEAIKEALSIACEKGPQLAMVDAKRGITNFHVSSDVIVDASMPAMIRDGGKMWNKKGEFQETLALIPDRAYAGVFQATIDDCRDNGALNPVTLGTVENVGLMAEQAEEYGSHDKTFQVKGRGIIRVINQASQILMQHSVDEGDIFRMCQTKDAAVRNWVELALSRAKITGYPTVFWLDENRAHDQELIAKVKETLATLDQTDTNIKIMAPKEAAEFSLTTIRQGKNIISVTGNVLRDYLTDLFPILELGTSSKMLSIVPLMKGGGLFETGAGGTAPRHVAQFIEEGYLRWDSLGEYLALAESLKHLGRTQKNSQALVLAEALDKANLEFLQNDRSPARELGKIDNRGSSFYMALYWAQALSNQDADLVLKEQFSGVYQSLLAKESVINAELIGAQGLPQQLGGYYLPNIDDVEKAMRPSQTFNQILATLH